MTKTIRRVARALRGPKRRPVRRDVPGEALAPINRELKALARLVQASTPAKVDVLPAPEHGAMLNPLGEEAVMGALGLVELKLTPEEEAALATPVDPARVSIKPTGQPYLSHPEYTRWFGKAFGRTGWAIVPVGKPTRADKSIVVPYILYVHGKPIASAYGEQEYFETNRDQTWGDALESTVASALRRCAKRLGVGLEMWDRAWLDAWVAEHCVKVRVIKNVRGGDGSWQKKGVYAWRRKDQAPLANEVTGDKTADDTEDDREEYRQDVEPAQRRTSPPRREREREPKSVDRGRREPATHSHENTGDRISEPQLRRFWAIVRNSGRTEDEVREWILARYKIEHMDHIRRRDYEEICDAIEGEDRLP